MRGHVHHVARGRHQALQPVGRGQGPLGSVGTLDRVDVEVMGARMIGSDLEDALEGFHDLRRVLAALLVGPPGTPVEVDVHQGVREERPHHRVVREPLPDLTHRVGVGDVQFAPVLGRRVRVALCQRLDQLALDIGGAIRHRECPRCSLVRPPRDVLVLHRSVDVGAQDVGLSPESHGAIGIEACGLLERAQRLVVVETPRQGEPLVEVGLCERDVGAHGATRIAQPFVKGWRGRGGLRRRAREEKRGDEKCENVHG